VPFSAWLQFRIGFSCAFAGGFPESTRKQHTRGRFNMQVGGVSVALPTYPIPLFKELQHSASND
jgi:hypothetical protein